MLHPNEPALVLAPMDGITDAPMRALQGLSGAFTYAVSEFIRVTTEPLPRKVFRREVPELEHGGLTPTGLPVQVQILGGNPEPMAASAANAVRAGATAIDINFGCPAPTVNRNDGGASLLRYPCRIREIVAAVRQAVPGSIPVSAKLRLGWDTTEAIHENATMAAEGGASWLTIHARTRVQGYTPPVYWAPIAAVREALTIPIIANGDVWTFDNFLQCQEETGCIHFMIGRGALANPRLARQIAERLGIARPVAASENEWEHLFRTLLEYTQLYEDRIKPRPLLRLKQWLKIAHNHGDFDRFDVLKHAQSVDEFFELLAA